MKMSNISQIWDFFLNKTKDNPTEDFFYTKLIDEKFRHLFYAGVASNNSILIALETINQPPLIEEKVNSIKSFRHQRHDGKWLLVIQLVNYDLRDVFEKLCEDLIASTLEIKSSEVALSNTIKRLRLWITLLSKSNKGYLLDFQIKGLLAELNFIKKIVSVGKYSLSHVINSWVGPSSAPQDFIFNKEAFEIKAVSVGKKIVSISSLDQLDFNGDLNLVVCELLACDRDNFNKTNLNLIVSEISSLINDTDLLTLFKTKLLEVGYFNHTFYDNKNYEINKMYKIIVDNIFPKLIREQVPREIINASYEINIDQLLKENL
jgi:hypothetical protein